VAKPIIISNDLALYSQKNAPTFIIINIFSAINSRANMIGVFENSSLRYLAIFYMAIL